MCIPKIASRANSSSARRSVGEWLPVLGLVVLFVGLLAGLLVGPALAVGEKAGTKASKQKWLRLDTANFTVFSAANEDITRQVGRDLETLRAVLSFWLQGEEVHSPVPTYIYVFAGDPTFMPYKKGLRGDPKGVAGYFISHTLGNYVALDGSPQSDPSRVVYHEYLHYFTANNLPGVPLWFNEGLAEFYSTFQADGDKVLLGEGVKHHQRWLSSHPEFDLERLFSVTHKSSDYNEGSRRGGFYAQSWAMVHYLMAGSPERSQQLIRYLELVVDGVDPEEAFGQAFETDFRTLERELESYLSKPNLPGFRLSVQGLGASVREGELSRMPRAEALYRLGDLMTFADMRHPEDARAHFLEALDLDPQHGSAWAGLGFLEDQAESYDDARGYYERALELDPQDFRIHYLYGRNLLEPWTGRRLTEADLRGEPGEMITAARQAFERSLRLNPDFPEAWVGLGAAWALEPEPTGQGLDALRQARRLLPSRGDVVFNLAMAYARVGRRDEARAVIRHDLTRLGDDEMVREATEAVLRADLEHASALLEEGRVEPAQAILERIIDATTDPTWRLDLQRQLENMRTVTSYNRQVERFNEAVSHANGGRHEEALSVLEELLEEDLNAELERRARDMQRQLQARTRR